MIKVIELFSGIGSQTQALKNQNIEHEIVGISEWSINSIISYGILHCDNTDYNLTKQEIIEELKEYTFSSDTKKPIELKRINEKKLKLLYKHHKNSKNFGSIKDMKGKNISGVDLLTYSFPCQDLSVIGKRKGLYEGNSSSLLWEVKRLLEETDKLPKYLLMENVYSLLYKKYEPGFKEWTDFLESKGYYNYKMVLKASDFGVPQNRDRVFMISSLTDLGDIEGRIRKHEKRTELRISDILKDEAPVYSEKATNCIPKHFEFKETENNILRLRLENYSKFNTENDFISINSMCPTITASGAYSNIKVYENGKIRIITPHTMWRLMGFTTEHYNKVKDVHSISELKKQAGNSIVVNVLEVIFKELFK